MKYSGWAEIKSIKEKWEKKPTLYAVKMNNGYCFFQYAGEVIVTKVNGRIQTHKYYIVYETVLDILPRNPKNLSSSKYFYVKECLFNPDSLKDITELKMLTSIKNQSGEWEPRKVPLFNLGCYKLPKTITPPRFSRHYDWNLYTNKIKLEKFDCYQGKLFIFSEKEESEEYLKLSPYAGELRIWLEHLEKGFTLKDWNLDRIKEKAEKYYNENPHMRPTDEKYDDVKQNYPVKEWREPLESNEETKEYLEFCDRVESALKNFTNALDINSKQVQKPLVNLVKELNKISDETGFIGTLEREDLSDYIAKILASLKKSILIETLDRSREW